MPRDNDDDTSAPSDGKPVVPRDPQATETASDDVGDALHAIGTMTTWVTHADTKAGLLAAAVAVVLAAMAQDREMIGDVARSAGTAEIVSAVVLVGIGIAVIVAVIALGTAVTPRHRTDSSPARFGLPTLADPGWTRTRAARADVADEAWVQAVALAQIASRKFSQVRVASIAVTVALLLLGAWTVVTSFVS